MASARFYFFLLKVFVHAKDKRCRFKVPNVTHPHERKLLLAVVDGDWGINDPELSDLSDILKSEDVGHSTIARGIEIAREKEKPKQEAESN